MLTLWFAQALLPSGWRKSVRLHIAQGRVAIIETDVDPDANETRFGTALPGMPNVHSHAFQRLMAGLAEARSGPECDDFWSWRDLMYRLVAAISPDDLAAIAAMAFAEMLEGGFTRVGEFHYLHHQTDGRPFDDPAEMAVALAVAAEQTGMALTLLPVFYAHSGFGGLPPHAGQRRFINDLEGFARLHEASKRGLAGLPDASVGVAPHSLRAVTSDQLAMLVGLAPEAPLHIHIAEQAKEVEDCVAWSGRRPVEWLLSTHDVNPRWCLVHATHITTRECVDIALTGAVVGLCPITEANLGDGIFPAPALLGSAGRFGIGSDSNVRIGAAEELRTLEYGQRLTLGKRTVLADPDRSNGRLLFDHAVAGGHIALGSSGGLKVGERADVVELSQAPVDGDDRALDRWIFAKGAVARVWSAGRQVVSDGRHHDRPAIVSRFDNVARRLIA